MDRMHRQRKSPCLSFDMYISNHFLNRIFFPLPSPNATLFYPLQQSFLLRISLCFYISLLHASNVALICFRLAFSSLRVAALVFQVFHIINIYKVVRCQFTQKMCFFFSFKFKDDGCIHGCTCLKVDFFFFPYYQSLKVLSIGLVLITITTECPQQNFKSRLFMSHCPDVSRSKCTFSI